MEFNIDEIKLYQYKVMICFCEVGLFGLQICPVHWDFVLWNAQAPGESFKGATVGLLHLAIGITYTTCFWKQTSDLIVIDSLIVVVFFFFLSFIYSTS